MKKVLIVGATSMVGNELVRALEKYPDEFIIFGTYYSKKGLNNTYEYLDLRDVAPFKPFFLSLKPDIIVIVGAYTHVDGCEEHPDVAYEMNIRGVGDLLLLAREYNSRVVFMSSDYVFDGTCGPYSEESQTNPISFYGKTKLIGEQLVQAMVSDHLIVRTTGVYDYSNVLPSSENYAKNFVLSLIRRIGKGEQVLVPDDQYSSPTLAENLATAVVLLLKGEKQGIYNVAGKDILNRYEFACSIADAFGLDKTYIKPVTTVELKQKALRPLASGLVLEKLYKGTGFEMLGVDSGLKRVKEKMNL